MTYINNPVIINSVCLMKKTIVIRKKCKWVLSMMCIWNGRKSINIIAITFKVYKYVIYYTANILLLICNNWMSLLFFFPFSWPSHIGCFSLHRRCPLIRLAIIRFEFLLLVVCAPTNEIFVSLSPLSFYWFLSLMFLLFFLSEFCVGYFFCSMSTLFSRA